MAKGWDWINNAYVPTDQMWADLYAFPQRWVTGIAPEPDEVELETVHFDESVIVEQASLDRVGSHVGRRSVNKLLERKVAAKVGVETPVEVEWVSNPTFDYERGQYVVTSWTARAVGEAVVAKDRPKATVAELHKRLLGGGQVTDFWFSDEENGYEFLFGRKT